MRLSRSYLVRATDEVRNPKSEVRLGPFVFAKLVEIRNPKIRSPRPHTESNKSEIPKSGVRDTRLRSKQGTPIPNPKIPSPAAPKRDSLEERVRNPKSDGALRRDRRQSERETPLVMSLMKSDRTKAPKSDRIVGYSITRRTRRHTAVWVGACLGVVARGTDARIRLAPDAARRWARYWTVVCV